MNANQNVNLMFQGVSLPNTATEEDSKAKRRCIEKNISDSLPETLIFHVELRKGSVLVTFFVLTSMSPEDVRNRLISAGRTLFANTFLEDEESDPPRVTTVLVINTCCLFC